MSPPAVVVHSLGHALAALAAATEVGRPLRLVSAPSAGLALGPSWFVHLLAAAAEAYPAARFDAVLDCGDAPGYAFQALTQGIKVRLDPCPKALTELAAGLGVGIEAVFPHPALDLHHVSDPLAACRAWLLDQPS